MPARDEIAGWNGADPAWMAREGAIPETATEEDGSLFPDGSRVVECTNWARYARRAHGARVKIYGFFCEDNPSATAMDRLAEGHDFAVLDNRFIIDGWLTSVEGELAEPLIDLEDPGMARAVQRFYGSPACWTRMLDLETAIEEEPDAAFADAMAGAAPVQQQAANLEIMEP